MYYCKECKHWHREDSIIGKQHLEHKLEGVVKEDAKRSKTAEDMWEELPPFLKTVFYLFVFGLIFVIAGFVLQILGLGMCLAGVCSLVILVVGMCLFVAAVEFR